jgi:hypothetical protein
MLDERCDCGASMLFIEAVEPNADDPAIGPIASSILWCPTHSFWRVYVSGKREQILGKSLGVLPSRGALSAFTVVTYWRLVNPAGQVLICELCRTAVGLEVRCGYEGQELLRAQRASSAAAAFCVARAWHQVAVEQNGFAELSTQTR